MVFKRAFLNNGHFFPLSSLEKKSLLRDNVDLLGSLADLYFRAGDNKNSILKFEQAQMLDPYLIKGELILRGGWPEE